MNESKNILVTTLGASWQIVPEIVGWTNPSQFGFFKDNANVAELRDKHNISPVDEFWVVTTEQQKEYDKLKRWVEHWKITVRFFICKGVSDFQTEDDITKFRSLLFRVVLKAREETANSEKLYLSLTGGRKTMSADMYEAGILFGCDLLFHIMDVNPPKEQKDDDLLCAEGKYASYYLPVVVGEQIPSNFIISAGDQLITSKNYPIDISLLEQDFDEDSSLAKEISNRKQQSSQIYSNFYQHIRNQVNERDIFRQLYFLHPDILRKLKEIEIGFDYKRDIQLLRSLPKADLHTHLGGVLTVEDIIQVAKSIDNEQIKSKSEKIQQHIHKILEFADKQSEFEKHIFGDLIIPEKYHKIGIDKYQKLGDEQGSALLQTKETIAKTVEIYAQNLVEDNVKYVEIRCSPYKYTREGLTISEVVDAIMNSMDKFSNKITYHLICIIGRQSGLEEIKSSVDEILKLLESNQRFADKLVGIDLAGNEAYSNPKTLREHFMPFLEKCIHITIHAGETESVDNIWQAVYHLSADRIGHGLKLLEREEMIP